MVTIREWLNEAGFNWHEGHIIYQETGDSPGWGRPLSAKEIGSTHPILDEEFYDGYGGAQCPRFIAEDDKALYFPEQYDGATSLVKVFKDITEYLKLENPTPYPGG